jgi:hypothetical protein
LEGELGAPISIDPLGRINVTKDNDDNTDCRLRLHHRERETFSSLAQRAFERARGGDRAAAGFLYARYGDEVYECLRTTLGDHTRAREATRCIFAFGETSEWVAPQLASPRACLLDGARRLAHRVAADPTLRLSA